MDCELWECELNLCRPAVERELVGGERHDALHCHSNQEGHRFRHSDPGNNFQLTLYLLMNLLKNISLIN